MLAGRVAQPVLRLAQIWQDFHQARISIARLGDILNTAPEPSLDAGPRGVAGDQRRPSLSSMSTFRYRVDGPRRCCTISTSAVPAGQVVGIVGPSGSGKSTFAKLVQRLYMPESGRVLIDGVDLAMVDVIVAAAPGRRGAAGERALQPLDPRQYRSGRSRHADRAGDRSGEARRRA